MKARIKRVKTDLLTPAGESMSTDTQYYPQIKPWWSPFWVTLDLLGCYSEAQARVAIYEWLGKKVKEVTYIYVNVSK